MSIRVLVVDDHLAFAEALSLALRFEDGIDTVGCVGSIGEAVHSLTGAPVDVVVLDWQLPDMDGIAGIPRIKSARPDAEVVMITAHASAALRALAMNAGAAAFLPKQSSIQEIVDTVRACVPPVPVDHSKALTRRELDVLQLLADGKDVSAIAHQLFLSINTVRGYVKDIRRKLDAKSQLEAVVNAQRQGLLVRRRSIGNVTTNLDPPAGRSA